MTTDRRGRILDVATGVVVLCAILVAGASGWARYVDPWLATRPIRVENWEQYATGHRVGPVDARVTVVWWGDYECPVCQSTKPILDAVVEEFGGDVAIVHKHWPLPYHEAAYLAARAAECAAAQGLFRDYDRALYDSGVAGWETEPSNFVAVAGGVGVPDLETFTGCVMSEGPAPSIERDVEDVARLGGTGTPTLMINGLLLRGGFPPADELRELLRYARNHG